MRVRMNRIELTSDENAALEEAHRIVAERAKKENGDYDEEMLEWWFFGLLNTGHSTEEMLEWARITPFQQKKERNRGYA